MRTAPFWLAAALAVPWPARLLAHDCREQGDSCLETCSIDHGLERDRTRLRACLVRCSEDESRCRAQPSQRPSRKAASERPDAGTSAGRGKPADRALTGGDAGAQPPSKPPPRATPAPAGAGAERATFGP
jgi:hypothetical protein